MPETLTGFPHLRRLAFALSAGAAAAAVQLQPAGAQSASSTVPKLEAAGIRLGVYDPHGTFANARSIEVEHIFMPWQEIDWATLRAADAYAANRGRELLISIEPWSWSGDNALPKEALAAAIAAGEYDPKIDAFCQVAAGLTSRTTIRWGHEMDETTGRYSWSGLQPKQYVQAYRRFVDQCRKSAPQALFMWSPKGEPNLAAYYPGDDYADSVGISLFGLEVYDVREYGHARTFREAMRERYDRVAAFGKPVVAAEFGFTGGRDYVADWAAEMTCSDAEFPLLDSVIYFNDVETHAWPGNYGNPDWRQTPDRFERNCDRKIGLAPPTPDPANFTLRAGAESSLFPIEPSSTGSLPTISEPAGEPAAIEPPAPDADSVPMLAWELAKLYGGKSWMWSGGAGYLAADRRFLAWSGSGEAATYAVGRWSVTDRGRMCFKAVWHSTGGSGLDSTCFSHRKIGSTIIQKKEPDGHWYVFRSGEANASDEHRKLQDGDAVSAKLSELQESLAQVR